MDSKTIFENLLSLPPEAKLKFLQSLAQLMQVEKEWRLLAEVGDQFLPHAREVARRVVARLKAMPLTSHIADITDTVTQVAQVYFGPPQLDLDFLNRRARAGKAYIEANFTPSTLVAAYGIWIDEWTKVFAEKAPEPLQARLTKAFALVSLYNLALVIAQFSYEAGQRVQAQDRLLVQLGLELLRARSEEQIIHTAVTLLADHLGGAGFLSEKGEIIAWAGHQPKPGRWAVETPIGRFGKLVLVFNTEVSEKSPLKSEEFLGILEGLLLGAFTRIRAERQLIYLEDHDELTGLLNYKTIKEALDKVVQRIQRGKEPNRGALILIDLDGFEEINNVFGHSIGDRVLQVVGRRLLRSVRPGDVVGRLAGDEFVVLLPNAGSHPEHTLMRVGNRLLHELHRPITIAGHRIPGLSAALGFAIIDGSANAEEVLQNAEIALFRAKKEKPGQMAFSEPEIQQRMLAEMKLGMALREAVQNGMRGFRLVYQPIVDMQEERWLYLEALLRFSAPGIGPVPPSVFVPIAEEIGLIQDLGQFALQRALAFAARTGYKVAVNISPHELTPEYPKAIRQALHATGTPPQQLILEQVVKPSQLILELTERAVMNQQTLAVLMELARMGIEISLDDLGTGYSSLERLAQLPLASLKIPYEFTSQLGPTPDPHNSIARIMNAILAMGNALGLRVIVEGVETPAQKAFLLAQGFTFGQGFLFSPPLEESEVPPPQA